MKKLFLLPIVLWALGSFGQFQPKTGSITVSGASCTATTICVDVPITQSNASTIVVTITGTWSGTLQFEGTANDPAPTFVAIDGTPQPSGATVSSTTANGTWVFDVAGFNDFRVRASSLASGTAVVTINPSPAVNDATVNLNSGATVAISQTTPGSTNGVNIAPSSVSTVGIVPGASSAVESNHVLKASAGNLYSLNVTATTNGLVMVFNSTTVPGDGAVTPLYCHALTINSSGVGTWTIDNPSIPSVFGTGISVAFSTGTNCANKAASATAWFTWRVQ
jgi:hypothetical protein